MIFSLSFDYFFQTLICKKKKKKLKDMYNKKITDLF